MRWGITCPDGHTLQGNCRTQRSMVLQWMLRDGPWMISGKKARTREFLQQEYSGEFLDGVTLAPLSVSTFPLPSPECYVSSLTDTSSVQVHSQFQELVSHSLSHVCSSSEPPPAEYVAALRDLSWHMPGAVQYAISELKSVKVPPAVSIFTAGLV